MTNRLPELHPDHEYIAREAVRRVRVPASQSRVSGVGRNGFFPVDDGGTVPGDDGGGGVLTLHTFIWGIDEFGDSAAYFGDVPQG